MSVLGTSIPVILAKKKAVENTKDDKNLETTIGADEDNENLKTNFVQVLCI